MAVTVLLFAASLFVFAGWTHAGEDPILLKVGAPRSIGCGPNAKRVKRLVIDKPGVYENYLVDGEWGGSTLVKINADNVTLRARRGR